MPTAKRRPRVNLPYLIKDRAYMRDDPADDLIHIELATPLQTFSAIDDGKFEDGPANDRVMVLDFDLETGQASEKRKFVPQGIGKSVSCYDIGYSDLGPDSDPEAFEAVEFLQVSTFATVLKVIDFFESGDILGRKIEWAFDGDRLMIIPRAGRGKNAFYDRRNRNLQFYFYPSKKGHTIYTGLSHDIVVHETAHAVLDGIAPDLYDSILPQSLALHEAIADITAISQTLLNKMVLFSYDALTGGTDKDEYSALTSIAEEFGSDIRSAEGKNYLRRMKNAFCLKPDNMPDPDAAEVVAAEDPHQLSLVLSGILYSVIENRVSATSRPGAGIFATLETTFIPAARRVTRIIFRALDYLPPGEASFVDYGRAFVLAARTTYRKPQKEIRWIQQAFLQRGVVEREDELEPDFNQAKTRLTKTQADKIAGDDAVALEFVAEHRETLGLPADRQFQVVSRTIARKSIGSRKQNEVLVKLRWPEVEAHDTGLGREWSVQKGATLVLDLDSNFCSVLQTTTNDYLIHQRGSMLAKLEKAGRLVLAGKEAGKPSQSNRLAVVDKNGALRLEGALRLLHIIGD